MEKEWDSEELGKRGEWVSRVKTKVWKRETEKWRKGMEGKTKLDRYRVIKTELKYESYLDCGSKRAEVADFVQCRGGVAKLRIETGRWIGLQRGERVCEFCESGEVEDEVHMMTRCSRWKEVWKELSEEWRVRGLEEEKAVQWTLTGMTLRGRGTTQMRRVMKAVGKGMRLREGQGRRDKKERKTKEDKDRAKKAQDRKERKTKEDKVSTKKTKKTRIVWRMRVK
jgi:hypothetical protein